MDAEGQSDLLRDPGITPGRIPLFHVDGRGDDVLGGSLGTGLRRHRGREEPPIFPLCQRSMQVQERGGFEDDRGTDHPGRSHEKRTEADNHAIRHAEIGGPFSGSIEDQQLVLDEDGFSNH